MTCERLEGIEGDRIKLDFCGMPADPKSKRVSGTWLCADHLEDWCRREM